MPELWDLYDAERRPLGRTHPRGTPLGPGDYHVVVEIWTVTPAGEILITLRDPAKEFGSLWECTGGSALAGDSSLGAAVRELEEETGIVARPEALTLLHTALVPQVGGIFDTYLLRQAVDLSALRLQPGETVDAQLVDREALYRMMAAGEFPPPTYDRFKTYRARWEAAIDGAL